MCLLRSHQGGASLPHLIPLTYYYYNRLNLAMGELTLEDARVAVIIAVGDARCGNGVR